MADTVVIAGAGPAGLMLAYELALAGVQTLVLEQLAEPIPWSRSMALHLRSVEVLRQRGLADFADAQPWSSYNFGFLELTRIIDDPKLIPLIVPQRRVEDMLERHARALGVPIRRGHQVVGLDQDDVGVTVTVRAATGDYQVRAGYLVGCDGGRSTVRKLAGIAFPGTESTVHGITADIELADERFPGGIPPRIYPNGLFAVVPFEPGISRVTSMEFGVRPPERGVPVTESELHANVLRVGNVRLRIASVRWLARFGNATRLAERYRAGRILLAGDAAHIHFPSAGQGLNTSIQDAVNLGWKLAAEVNGWAPPGLLDTYHSERHPVGQRVCMYSQAQSALYHPLDRVGPLREVFSGLLRLPEVSRHMLDLSTGLGLRYEMGAPTAGRSGAVAHPLLGRRVPDAALSTPGGPASVAATLHRGRGVLLHLTDPTPHADRADRVVAAGWPDRVERVRARPTPELDATVLLIRPDGYIAYADRTGTDHDGLQHALTTWFGHPTSPTRAASGALSTAGPDGSRDRPAVAPAGG